jgi:hypothetical protein
MLRRGLQFVNIDFNLGYSVRRLRQLLVLGDVANVPKLERRGQYYSEQLCSRLTDVPASSATIAFPTG